MKRIEMLRTEKGAEHGLNTREYHKGQTYTINDDHLADAFIGMGAAKAAPAAVPAPEAKAVAAAPENKAVEAAPANKGKFPGFGKKGK